MDLYLGAMSTYASGNYMETYFGVSPANAFRSGLPVYSADAGFKDVGGTVGGVMYLSKEWALSAGLQYRRLLSEAKDSPIVSDRGDANQWIAGVGIARLWW